MTDNHYHPKINAIRLQLLNIIMENPSLVPELGGLLCVTLGSIIGVLSKDEGRLLDGVKLANEKIRTQAAEIFVQIQKSRSER